VTLRSACMWLASLAAVACLTACQNGTLTISFPTSGPSHGRPSRDSTGQDGTGQNGTGQDGTGQTGNQGSSGRPLLRVHDPRRVTGTITGHCTSRDHGRLPDRRCTPGAVDPNVTQGNLRLTICHPGYTKTVRPSSSVTDRFKYEVAYPAYHEPHSKKAELDHLVSLELGGANDAANLWPEYPPTPNPKDKVENALHAAVCDGRVKLTAAQNAIARNWETAERVLGIS
jgi:hypothetical protein